MRMIYTFVSTSVVIFSAIGCSSQSSENHRSVRPSGLPLAAVGIQHTPGRPSQGEALVRARSRSPARTPNSTTVLGYSLEELGYIRLIPRTNERLQYEFRKYTFPVGKPIRLRAGQGRFDLVPAGEHIVLSTSNGEVFAILDLSGTLLGIYTTNRSHSRIKMITLSGAFEHLTADEIRDCPVGKKNPIFPNSYEKTHANQDSLRYVWCPHSEPQEISVPARSRYLHGRPPSDEVLGCPFGRLGYIRLIPSTNQNRRFEFRRYVFPASERIRMKIDQMTYMVAENQEYLVLSTSDDDIFAILDSSDTLRGIYRTDKGNSRIKINMISGKVDILTRDEGRHCPVGKNHPVFPNTFIKGFADYNSLNLERNSGSYPSATQHSLQLTLPEEPPLRDRSKSPPGRPPFHEVLGYSLERLGFVRLIPQANQNRRFEFRRYVIPDNKQIRLQMERTFVPVPTREYIVLSTSNDDVFAILEYSGILRGIYRSGRYHPRVKINMISGTVDNMVASEISECHVGNKYKICPRWFTEDVSNEDSLHHVYL